MSDFLRTLPESSRVILERRKVGASVTTTMEYQRRPELLFDQMVHSLTAYVMAERLADDTYTERAQVPASWWQHWKQARKHELTRWIPRKFPPKMRTLEVTVRWERHATRPYSNWVMPDMGPVVYQESMTPAAVWNV